MKRKILVLAVILSAVGLAACGNNEEQAANDVTQTIQTESSGEAESTGNSEKETGQVATI